MRHKLQSGLFVVMLAFLLVVQLLGCCVTVQCANNSDIYSDCETNFTTLENALIHTSDNAYKLWTTFFPPREGGSLFVVVTYQIINSTTSIDYIWTTASFALIHPPHVFGMISLFFGLVEEDRIQNVTVQLPESCRDLLTPDYGRTNEEAESNFLEVLTQRLRLYAKFRSTGYHIAPSDVFEAKGVVFTPSAIKELYHNRDNIGVFFSLLFGIPLLLLPFVIVFVKGTRAQIRTRIRDPKHHSSLAALVSFSFLFSVFAVGMDITAVYFAFNYDNALATVLPPGDNIPFHFLPAILALDGIALLTAAGVLVTLCCPHDFLHRCCFNFWLSSIFCCQPFSGEKSCRSSCQACLKVLCCCGCKKYCEKLSNETNDKNRNEQKVWLLTITFASFLVTFGTHFPYILIAWIEYPDHAGAIAIMYALSFLYYFLTFRYLYQFLPNNKADLCSCRCCRSSGSSVESPADEMAKCIQSEMEGFKIWKVWVMIIFGLFLVGVEIWFMAGLVQLPIAQIIDDAPRYIFAFFQTMVVVLSGLLTYKLLTFHVTDTSTFFTTLVQACKHLSIKSNKPKPVSDMERAAVLLGVIVHQHSNSTPAGTCGDADELWNDMVKN